DDGKFSHREEGVDQDEQDDDQCLDTVRIHVRGAVPLLMLWFSVRPGFSGKIFKKIERGALSNVQ
ncbi:MAG: hypothetical protein LWW75_01460, partial [Chlorobiales bacterium]|nr:hypothetical protein [Chlorobiales bacterium]